MEDDLQYVDRTKRSAQAAMMGTGRSMFANDVKKSTQRSINFQILEEYNLENKQIDTSTEVVSASKSQHSKSRTLGYRQIEPVTKTLVSERLGTFERMSQTHSSARIAHEESKLNQSKLSASRVAAEVNVSH